MRLFHLLLVLSIAFLPLRASKVPRDKSSAPPQKSLPLEADLVRTNNVGVALMEQLKFEEAGRQFQRLIILDPEFVPGHVNLGISKYYSQEYGEALHSFQRALELKPDQLQALYMIGLVHRNQANAAEALESFRKVFSIDPQDPSTNYFLGLLYRRERAFDQAVSHLRTAIEIQPFNASARYNLAIALQRSGKGEAGKKEMQEFQRLQGQFGTDTVGLQYLEQGTYSMVLDHLDPYLEAHSDAVETLSITLKEVSSEVGLQASTRRRPLRQKATKPGAPVPQSVLEGLGSGISFGDFDGDGWYDLFVADSSLSKGGNRLFRNVRGHFVEVTEKAGLAGTGATMSGIWGDYDNDGGLDLYLVRIGSNRLYNNQGDGSFSDQSSEAGVDDEGVGSTATAVDFDHDGDLDIYVANLLAPKQIARTIKGFQTRGHTNVLYRNNGDGTFTDVANTAGVDGGNSSTSAVFAVDINNSRDVDLLALNSDTAPVIFSNQRNGTFRRLNLPFEQPVLALALGDINRDGKMDLVAGFGGPVPKISLFWNVSGTSFRPDPGTDSLLPGREAVALQTLDTDNDGDLDILALTREKSAGLIKTSLHLFENRRGDWVEINASFEDHGNLAVRGLSVTDFDNDGDLDFAVGVNRSLPLLFRNDTEDRNNWLQLELAGTNSNRPGIGTKVEVLAGRLWQKAEALGGHGAMSQNPPLIHFGLGSNRPDAVRLLWPGGVLQSEIDPLVNQRLRIQELDRKGTSCPILYVWDGSDYRFQTDFLGGSAFGTLVTPGTYNYPDTDEYIKLSRQDTTLKEGKLAITLNNQLEEIIFFDQLEVVAVDHPKDFEIHPDEKLLPGPPYDSFRVLTFERPRPPISAIDGSGRNVLEEIRYIDRVYPVLFEPLPFKGYANLHELVLDLGETRDERVLLLMHAWIDYADSTSNLAASQAGIHPVMPYLQVEDKSGHWVTVQERMGFPAGLPKPMTVDLTGKFLSPSRKVKIVTNLRIHWDQILVENTPARHDLRTSRLAPSKATLQFGGFPEFSSSDRLEPKTYNYSNKSRVAQWKTHMGAYTRYGDVRPLLLGLDDLFVITRSGDEIEAFFEVANLPPLPRGWTRDYLVFVDGFGKDMDINSASSDYVGPLPFHGMTSFPYPAGEGYPNTLLHREYLKTWNTRVVNEWLPPLNPRGQFVSQSLFDPRIQIPNSDSSVVDGGREAGKCEKERVRDIPGPRPQ